MALNNLTTTLNPISVSCNFFTLYLSFVLVSLQLHAQQKIEKTKVDSLSGLEFQELSSLIKKKKGDPGAVLNLSAAFLLRAKRKSASINSASGYYYLAKAYNNSKTLIYADSIIEFTKHNPSSYYPVLGYILKGDYYYEKRELQKSLDVYLFIHNEYKEAIEPSLYQHVKHNIGLLKSRIGKDKEALSLFKEGNKYWVNRKLKYADSLRLLANLFALSDSYTRNKKYDSATTINTLGYTNAVRINSIKMSNYFRLNQGVNEYWSNNNRAAVDSLCNALPYLDSLEDLPNIAFGNYYLGKSLLKLSDTTEGIKHIKRVDSVFNKLNDIHPELRNAYEDLLTYYKVDQNDLQQQLYYVNQLLRVDSVLNNNYKYLITNLHTKYDQPTLLTAKENIIASLEKNRRNLRVRIGVLTLATVLLLFILYKLNQRRIFYKTKLNFTNSKKGAATNFIISEDVRNQILYKCKKFESERGFISPEVSLNTLSKKFETNSKYLATVIKSEYNKSFIDYINFLRIEYAVKCLYEDPIFRKFTIKAIAEHVGFNNSISFSRAFEKFKSTKPSLFIKNLKD